MERICKENNLKNAILTSLFLIVSGIFLTGFINCRSASKKDQGNELESFTDSEKIFRINVSGDHDMKETSGEGFRLVELSAVDEEGITLYIIRIRIIDGEKDLYDPGYEVFFLADCKCTILERGSVHFAGKPARHFTVTLRNGEWLGYHRHFTGKGKMFILSVSGPKENSRNLHALFDQAIANFQLLDK